MAPRLAEDRLPTRQVTGFEKRASENSLFIQTSYRYSFSDSGGSSIVPVDPIMT